MLPKACASSNNERSLASHSIQSMRASKSITFNALDWYEGDEFENGNYRDGKRYVIRIFGRTEDDKSVAVKVENFTPFFFVEIPLDWNKKVADSFYEFIIDKCEEEDTGKREIRGQMRDKDCSYHTKHLIAYDVVEKYKFHGFTAGKKFKFIRFVFNNMIAMKRVARVFAKPIEFNYGSDNSNIISSKYQIYESNIDPYLRFIHIRDLDSCGWIKIDKGDYTQNEELTTTDINIKCDWKKVFKEDKIGIAPFKIASFDIECTSGDGSFPMAQRLSDKIIQIGTSFTRYGSTEPYLKTIVTLGECAPIDGARVISCKSERDVLLKWQKHIQEEDPDILTGYNIFYFDERYMYDRAKLSSIDCLDEFSCLSRMATWKCEWKESKLSSSALGDNIIRFFRTPGRVQIDLMKVVQRDHKLNSYKLDSVAETFIKEPVKSIQCQDETYIIETKNTHTVKKGNYIKIEENGEYLESKLQITHITDSTIHAKPDEAFELDATAKLYWGLVKDDIHPNDIFRLQKGNADDRKLIAVYCIQDCVLVSKLMTKLDVIVNNMSMANVCYVPVSYIFLRGQGIKSLSLVSKECRRKNYLIPVIKKANNSDTDQEEDVGYEGATVFEPHIGFHKVPISVLDFNSLYPSSEIAYNMSHESIVLDPLYDNLPDYTYKEITYRNLDGTETTCRFAKHVNGDYGIIPSILDKLIKGRKETKKQMEAESDPFKKSILDGKQNALKVTANSLYGQLGAGTSPICMKELAASTTAVGRFMLESARDFVEGRFVEILESLYKGEDIEGILDMELEDRKNNKFIEMMMECVMEMFPNYYVAPVVIYGDTDSIFIKMNITDRDTEEVLCDKKALEWSIKLAMAASKLLKIRLPPPENMEYEKTFWPFAIMAKKKYVGNKYEDSPEKFKQASMGIVLKRRDNANIVKKIIGGIIDIMMNEMDVKKTKKFAKQFVKDMLQGHYPIKDFITTKTLKGSYKVTLVDEAGNKTPTTVNVTDALKDKSEIEGMCTPDMNETQKKKLREYHMNEAMKLDKVSMAHVKLAKRMAERDAGNKPQINERIPFVTIEKYKPRGVKLLQGDMIEHPDYIKANNLRVDYLFYLTNQIVNPAVQILDLIIDNSKDKIFTKTIDKYKEERKIRDEQEANRIKSDQIQKLNNERIERFKWAPAVDDEDETSRWMDPESMLNIIAETKPKSKKKKKIIV